MIARMKKRVTLSLDGDTVEYLTRRAEAETNGNLSVYVDRVVRNAALAESAAAHAAWFSAHPGYLDDAEAERDAAAAA
jgi:hypothetical protein